MSAGFVWYHPSFASAPGFRGLESFAPEVSRVANLFSMAAIYISIGFLRIGPPTFSLVFVGTRHLDITHNTARENRRLIPEVKELEISFPGY